MKNEKNILESLIPKTKPNVMDLVSLAGLDVSDWANYERGLINPGANPKYCYEWCFEQEGVFVFNLWFENMETDNGNTFQQLNLRTRHSDTTGIRKVRAKRFDDAIQKCFKIGSNPRVIILDRAKHGQGGAKVRMLDRAPWTIVRYDYSSGDFEICRGVIPIDIETACDQELEDFAEGEMRRRFVVHRKREKKLRQEKIDAHMAKNYGKLICEVPRCGFDFESKYGKLGQGYAQVHHLKPLSKVEHEGTKNTIDDLAVVCANCHVMIHKGGRCRDLDEINSGIEKHV